MKKAYCDLLYRLFRESADVKRVFADGQTGTLVAMAELLTVTFRSRGKLFLFGNGGSAADAQHLAAEMVNRFTMERRSLPALALTVDSSVLTSIANDRDYESVFVRQLQGLASAGDAALGLSTSGRSENVIRALRWAREHGLHTLGFAGEARTPMDDYCDLIVHVPSVKTPRVQEVHITAGHGLCELVERMLFGSGTDAGGEVP